MKNIIKVLILILLAVGAYLIVDFIVAKSNKDVAVPDLTAISSEYGKVEQVELNEEKYVVYKNLLTSSSEFINKEINAQSTEEGGNIAYAAIALPPDLKFGIDTTIKITENHNNCLLSMSITPRWRRL